MKPHLPIAFILFALTIGLLVLRGTRNQTPNANSHRNPSYPHSTIGHPNAGTTATLPGTSRLLAIPEARQRQERVLQSASRGDIARLASLLADSSGEFAMRMEAAEALVAIGSIDALQSLFQALATEPNPELLTRLAKSLDALASPEDAEPLASLLEGELAPPLRHALMDTLARIAQEDTVAYLVEIHLRRADHRETPSPATEAMAAIANPVATPGLVAALNDPMLPRPVLDAAASGLAKISTKESLQALLERAASGTGNSAQAALAAWESLHAPEILPQLKQLGEAHPENSLSRRLANQAIKNILHQKDQMR